MPQKNSPSFIPKRTPGKKAAKEQTSRRVYILDYVAYIVFFGGLIATGAVFVLDVQANNQLYNVQEELVAEREEFSEAEMQRILELEKKINAAYDRIENHIAVSTLLTKLESLVVETVQFANFNFTRVDDTTVELVINVLTDSFDSTLSQREEFNQDELSENLLLQDISIQLERGLSQLSGSQSGVPVQPETAATRVSFTLNLDVPTDTILYDPTLYDLFPVVSPREAESNDVPFVSEDQPVNNGEDEI